MPISHAADSRFIFLSKYQTPPGRTNQFLARPVSAHNEDFYIISKPKCFRKVSRTKIVYVSLTNTYPTIFRGRFRLQARGKTSDALFWLDPHVRLGSKKFNERERSFRERIMFSDAVNGRDSVVVELAVKHGTRERMGSSILQMRVDSKGTYGHV